MMKTVRVLFSCLPVAFDSYTTTILNPLLIVRLQLCQDYGKNLFNKMLDYLGTQL
jgi:hypothetical protein